MVLARKAVEGFGGATRVTLGQERGARFLVTLPAAPLD